MKLALTAAAAILSLSLAGTAGATPSLSHAASHADFAGAEFVDVKFKFKKFGGHRGFNRGFRRGHLGGVRFGQHSYGFEKHGHFRKGAVVKKGHRGNDFFIDKGVVLK